MASSPYTYGSSQLPDGIGTDEEQLRRQASGGDSPAPYQPNDAAPTNQAVQKLNTQAGSSQAMQPSDRTPQPYQPPVTFAQQQQMGVARPPAPTAPASDATSGSQIFAGDPNRPGAGYITYNGQPMRIMGTTAAGVNQKGVPNSMNGAQYLLQGADGSEVTGPGVNVADYNAWVNGPHGTDAPMTPGVGAAPGAIPGDAAPQVGPGSNLMPQPGQSLPSNSPAMTPAGAGGPASGPVNAPTSTTPSTYGPGTTTLSNGVLSTQPFSVLDSLTSGAMGQGPGSDVQNATSQAALRMLNNPSPYGQQDVKDLYNWESGNIDDQYALKQKALDEQMAARGLGTSSIHAGNLQDLNIGQRSAKESMGQDLAHQYASTLGQYQQGAINTGNQVGTQAQNNSLNWLQNLMGYGQQAFNNDLATNAVNQNANNSWQNFIMSLINAGYSG